MRPYLLQLLYAALLVALIVLVYVLRMQPRRYRDWRWIALTVGFLTWLLLGLASLRS